MSKHTPGPWVVCPTVGLQVPVASVAMDGLKLNVAHAAGIRDGEGLANARLIAAAPELLEALEFIVSSDGTGYVDGHGFIDIVEIAQKAIGKAKGVGI